MDHRRLHDLLVLTSCSLSLLFFPSLGTKVVCCCFIKESITRFIRLQLDTTRANHASLCGHIACTTAGIIFSTLLLIPGC